MITLTRSVIAALTFFLRPPPTPNRRLKREQVRSEVTHRDESDETARRGAVAQTHRIVMQVGPGRQVRRLERMGCRRVSAGQ